MRALGRVGRLRTAGAGLVAGALVACFAPSASAYVPPERLVAAGHNLTAPTGVVRTPDGALWVADDQRGICRVDFEPAVALAESRFCGRDHAGPVSATGLAFDPVTQNLYAGDGASSGGAVWRLRWDAGSRSIEAGTPIVRMPDRVTAIALIPGEGPAADLLYATKESRAVMRVASPASSPVPARAAGFSAQPGATGIAELDGWVYLADGSDVRRFPLDPSATRVAVSLPGLAGGSPGAVVADPQRGRVYAGTSNGLDDHVFALDTATGTVSAYARGLAGISALAVDPDGALLVADDAMDAAGAIDSEGHGRIWRLALHSLWRPSVAIDAEPPGVLAASEATFAYSSAAASGFECRLDDGDWIACPGETAGSVTWPDLADGAHAFEIRALSAEGAGHPARRVFVVDTRAPRAWIAPGLPPHFEAEEDIWLEVLSDEPLASFECAVDGGDPVPCDFRTRLSGLPVGSHEVRVRAVDAAGNASDSGAEGASWSFEVQPRPPAAPAPAPAPAGGHPAPAPVVVTPAQTPARTTSSSAASKRADVAPAGLVARSLRLVPGSVVLPRAGTRAATLKLELTVPDGAVVARIVLKSSRRHLVVKEFRVVAGVNRIAFRLTRKESRRLRVGRHRVSVVLRDASGRRGSGRAHLLRIR